MSDSSTQSSAKSASTASFVTALVYNVAVFAIEIVLFTILRRKFKAIYEPRTYVPPENKRAQPLATGLLTWPIAIFNSNYDRVRLLNLDAYFFLRFLRMMVRIFLPLWLISWVILLPVNGAGRGGPQTGLNRFTIGNVTQSGRFSAHIILAWLFTAWILYNIRQEMQHFISERQRFLIDEEHSASAQANTILITGVPLKYLSESALTKMFSHLPGGVGKVWLNRDLKEMPDLYNRRLQACNKLESAETSLIHTATKRHNKQLKKDAKAGKKNPESQQTPAAAPDVEGNLTLVEKFVPQNKRPTHRLPLGPIPFSLPFVGKEVDSITWARDEITTTTNALTHCRSRLAEDVQTSFLADGNVTNSTIKAQQYPPLNSAFILFNRQIAAHMAAQMLLHHEPYRMSATYTEVAPADVIWGNLGLNPYEQKLRLLISYTCTAALIILWAFPVAFIGAVSNIKALCTKDYSWLRWLCGLPSPVIGIISGILPPVALAVLMMFLPIILRLLAKMEGIPRHTGVELSLMTRYFLFEVIHGFLIVTLSAGILQSLPGLLSNPSNIPGLLSSNLPGAATFFLTYIALQGLSGSAAGLLQIVALAIYYVKLYILGSTPRSVYRIKYTLRSVAWGTLFPSVTLITVISIVYSIIQPIMNGFACATFFLFYMVYKYIFLWVYDQPAAGDTGGLFFPKAIGHIFVGLYIEQICLCALFFLATDSTNKHVAIPEGALMVVLIIFTALYHMMINNSFNPLLNALPLSLADKSHILRSEGGTPPAAKQSEDGVEMNGMSRNHQRGLSTSTEKQRLEPGRDSEGPAPIPEKKGDLDGTVEVDEGRGPTDFDHPASYEEQRTIWIPKDTLGLGEEEEEAVRKVGILVSTDNAEMDGKGHVDISGPPPDDL